MQDHCKGAHHGDDAVLEDAGFEQRNDDSNPKRPERPSRGQSAPNYQRAISEIWTLLMTRYSPGVGVIARRALIATAELTTCNECADLMA